MTSELLDYIEINPKTEPLATIIWLHGLGADGHDFEHILPDLRLPDSLPIRFVFPNAPKRPVTINGGMVMRAWYDILDVQVSSRINMSDFLESVDHLEALIQNEWQSGTPFDRIVLAGFSQGGAIALHTGLRYKKKLTGILALSTILPTVDTLAKEGSQVNQDIPIMLAHGTWDPIIPIANTVRTKQELTRLGYRLSWHEYPMEHAVCAEEIRDIRSWLIKIFNGAPGA